MVAHFTITSLWVTASSFTGSHVKTTSAEKCGLTPRPSATHLPTIQHTVLFLGKLMQALNVASYDVTGSHE
jgi:hypothetical protein